jgi:general secretion pathway protein N
MVRRCAFMIAASASFSAYVALAQDAAAASGSDETGPIAEPQLTPVENPGLRQPPREGNPLWRIPIQSLFVTRERPLFSASRRPPTPPQAPPSPSRNAEAPPPLAELERPPLTLQGTAIGKPRDIALVLDEATNGSVRLHVGEAAEGWYLRSVDQRTMTIEKDSRIVVISLPAPGAAPPSPIANVTDGSDQPGGREDGRPRPKTGANWISIAHALY